MPEMNGFEATRAIRKYEGEKRATSRLLEADAGDIYADGIRSGEAEAEVEGAEGANIRADALKGTYVVALTGLGSSRDREEADEAGFNDFLTKPIRFAKIGELLELRSRRKYASLE